MPLASRHRQELLAIVSLLAGVFVALTLVPWDLTGPVGHAIGRFLLAALGAGAVLLPVVAAAAALAAFRRLGPLDVPRAAVLGAGLVALVPYAIAVVAVAGAPSRYPPSYETWTTIQRASGMAPAAVAHTVRGLVGTGGAAILGLLALSALTIYSLDWHPLRALLRKPAARAERTDASPPPATAAPWEGTGGGEEESPAPAARKARERRTSRTALLARPRANSAGTDEDQLPPLELLAPPTREQTEHWEEAIERQGQVLIETLATFRVEGKIVGRTTGPVVTQYEIAPAAGVKVGRIAALADDLALAMRAQSIRIVAPIPGRGAVGVEVPNPTPRIVTLRELLETADWDHARGALPVALGRNLEGRPIIADLAKMPHLLIAGATGSGKSICINTMITSLVYRYTPQRLRLLMVDPKMVELSLYNALPHLRHRVVTDNHQAAQVLKWAIKEMERRYRLFHANGARAIGDFNKKVEEGRELWAVESGLPDQRANGRIGESADRRTGEPADGPGDGESGEGEQLEIALPYDEGPLPYIVLVVDELADLMMTVQSEVEKPLAILAQKARATGIHLMLATQRPSVNVITGLIKANFPCRIAFRVASKVDSRTILDQNGAETLLGNGDMLFLPPGKSEPVRIQGAYIGTDETETLTRWFADRAKEREAALAKEGLAPVEEANILEQIEALEAEEEGGVGPGGTPAERDSLFRDAAEVCIVNQLGSTSLLQRKLRIGYGRAARIIDQLHEAGILGPPDGSKPREVLIGMGQLDEYC
jgi:S-DNA-T family DNA segregation ATPase FtsK/SpoIIIE